MLPSDAARLRSLQALYDAAIQDSDNSSMTPQEIDEFVELREKARIYSDQALLASTKAMPHSTSVSESVSRADGYERFASSQSNSGLVLIRRGLDRR